jgi:hypothetical protein
MKKEKKGNETMEIGRKRKEKRERTKTFMKTPSSRSRSENEGGLKYLGYIYGEKCIGLLRCRFD